MRMRNRTLIIVIAVLLVSNLLLLGVYLFGSPAKKTNTAPKNDRSPVEYMTKELKLDSSQREQFRELWESVQKKNRELYDSIRFQRESLYTNLKTEPQPDSIIHSITEKIAEFEKQISLNNYQHFRNVHAICDAEQQVRLDSVIARMVKRGKRR
jgi:protein CpxP